MGVQLEDRAVEVSMVEVVQVIPQQLLHLRVIPAERVLSPIQTMVAVAVAAPDHPAVQHLGL